MTLDPVDLEQYRASARRRAERKVAENVVRRASAWAAARTGAELLRDRFGARKVVLFGSLVDQDGKWFGVRSDIDLAAWGIADDDYFLAVAKLQDISPEFSFDLVAMERCPERLIEVIDAEGTAL